MEFRDKKYLDYAGLNDFWRLVKEYYKGTVDKADSALQNIIATVGDSSIVSIADGVATFDFSNFAKKSEIASVFTFKGTKPSFEELPSDAKAGDVYLVGDKEYVFIEDRWEELGYPIDLSNYYTKEEIDSKLQNLQDIEDLKNEVEGVKTSLSALDSKVTSLDSKVDTKVTELTNSLATETQERRDADALEARERKEADALEMKERKEAFNSISYIEDYHIRKLFKGVEVASKEDLVSAIANAQDGAVISLTSNTTFSASDTVAVAPGHHIAIEVPSGVTLSAEGRLVSVGVNGEEASTVELIGEGTIEKTGDNSEPLVFVRGGSNLVVDGVTLVNTSEANNSVIQTNGKQTDVNINIKSGTFTGGVYLPADGKISISGGTFNLGSGTFYIKSGELNISGGKFIKSSDSNDGNWAHWNNGSVDAPAPVTIEACNYGGHGNPVVSITGGEFINEAGNFEVLVIPYDGNEADMSGTTVGYHLANAVSGHVTSDGVTEPSDGWYKFTSNNTTYIPEK